MGRRNGPKRNERLQVMLSDAELAVIDEWRFRNRMPTRAATIRDLIRRGLEAAGLSDSEVSGMLRASAPVESSEEFGILPSKDR